MGYNTYPNADDLVFEYPENPESTLFDPCYGTVDAEGTVTVFPGVNGDPAFLPFEAQKDGDAHKKFVFDTKLTQEVLERAGFNTNFWQTEKGEWVTR